MTALLSKPVRTRNGCQQTQALLLQRLFCYPEKSPTGQGRARNNGCKPPWKGLGACGGAHNPAAIAAARIEGNSSIFAANSGRRPGVDVSGGGAGEALTLGGEAAAGAGGARIAVPVSVCWLGLSIGAHLALQSGSDCLQEATWGRGDAARTREILTHGRVPSAVQAVLSQPLSPVPPHAMSPADAAAAAAGRASAASLHHVC